MKYGLLFQVVISHGGEFLLLSLICIFFFFGGRSSSWLSTSDWPPRSHCTSWQVGLYSIPETENSGFCPKFGHYGHSTNSGQGIGAPSGMSSAPKHRLSYHKRSCSCPREDSFFFSWCYVWPSTHQYTEQDKLHDVRNNQWKLEWWVVNVITAQNVLTRDGPMCTLTTDASNEGWGGGSVWQTVYRRPLVLTYIILNY